MDAKEQAEGRDTIAAQYRQRSQRLLVQGLEVEHKLAEILLEWICDGTDAGANNRLVGMAWRQAEQPTDGQVGGHRTLGASNSPVAAMGGLAVTNRQLDALFVSNDSGGTGGQSAREYGRKPRRIGANCRPGSPL